MGDRAFGNEDSIRRYLSDLPLLHSWDDGETWNTGGFTEYHLLGMLRTIREHAPAAPRILETGAGNSTMLFLAAGAAEVVSIAPDANLFERIREACKTRGIPDRALEPLVQESQWALPALAAERRAHFDLALIDGAHGWPHVFVDLYYASWMLRTGGILALDDVQLYSVAQAAAFVAAQPGFEPVLDLDKLRLFKKTTETDFPDWDDQPYILRHTREPSKLRKELARLRRRARVAAWREER